jgi:hypothetical protein
MIVHYVEMNDVGPGGDHVPHLFAKSGEIGGKDAGGNAVSRHGIQDFGQSVILPWRASPDIPLPDGPGRAPIKHEEIYGSL